MEPSGKAQPYRTALRRVGEERDLLSFATTDSKVRTN